MVIRKDDASLAQYVPWSEVGKLIGSNLPVVELEGNGAHVTTNCAMPLPIPRNAFHHCIETAQEFSCATFICPCLDRHTVLLERSDSVAMGVNHVTFDATLKVTGSAVKTGFGDYSFMPRRCAHDQDLHWKVTVSMSQWEQVVSKGKTFIAVKAKRMMMTLDTSSRGSGVLADPDRRAFSTGDDSFVTAEFSLGASLVGLNRFGVSASWDMSSDIWSPLTQMR